MQEEFFSFCFIKISYMESSVTINIYAVVSEVEDAGINIMKMNHYDIGTKTAAGNCSPL